MLINVAKSKVVTFCRKQKVRDYKWTVAGLPLQQVTHFKYLGVMFSAALSWRTHLTSVIRAASSIGKALTRFFYTLGGQHVPSALRVFNSKVVGHLLYVTGVWIEGVTEDID